MEKETRHPFALNAKKVAQCKLCKLEETDPVIIKWIYELRFGCDLSHNKIAERVNNRLPEYRKEAGRNIPDINNMNLCTHLGNHIPVEMIRLYKTQVALRQTLAGTQIANASDLSKEQVEKAFKEAGELNLFTELLEMYKEYKKEHEEASKKETLKSDGGEEGEGQEDTENPKYAYARRDRMAKILVELNKMRQGDKLMGVIIKALMKIYSHGMMMASLAILERLKLDLAPHIDDPYMRDELVNKIKKDLGDAFVEEADKSLKNIRDNYPIPVLH